MSFPLPDHLKQIPNAEYQRLMKQVVHLQSGTVSNAIHDIGTGYGLNYGVQIPQIKQLLQQTRPNNALAFLLWNQAIREAKIMATFLFEPDKLTNQQVITLISTINNNELAEQMARNCLAQLPNSSLPMHNFEQWPVWGQYAVILAVARCVEQGTVSFADCQNLTNNLIQHLDHQNDSQLIPALAILFQKTYQQFAGHQQAVIQYITKFSNHPHQLISKAAQQFLWLNSL